MKSLFSYFITFLAVIYWGFRVAVSLMYSIGHEFVCEPLNANLEITILFLTIPSIIFIIRRNLVAATLYFGMYAAYFGTIICNSFSIFTSEEAQTLTLMDSTSLFVTGLGIVIPFLVFLDVAIQKSRFQPKDRDTDWYYENEKYDREYDERADRNQYKIK